MGIYSMLLVIFHGTVLVYSETICSIQVERYQDFVKLNQTALVKCSSNCTGISWETRLAKLNITESGNSSTLEAKIDDWDDSPIQCLVEHRDEIVARAKINVLPYVLPSKVDIELKEELEEDIEHKVTCSAYNVAPVKHAVLSVTRGGELFLSKTYEDDDRNFPENLTETFTLRANRNDNYKNFSCQVTLNLTNVANTTVQSSPVTVRTYALPKDPLITAEKWIEYGSSTIITCEVPLGFPSEEINIDLSIDGSTNTRANGSVFVSSTLNTSDFGPGQHTVSCTSEVHDSFRQSSTQIYLYESPDVNLTVSKNVVNVSDTVTIHCELTKGDVNYFSLSISVDGEEEKKENLPELAVIITITRRKPELSVTCKPFIQEDVRVFPASEVNLIVQYPPEFNNRSCPSPVIWVEGEESIFSCRSEGNPPSEEQCSFNNLPLQFPTSFTAERNMSGVYRCQASNSLQTVYQSVEVTVQYKPGTPTVYISSSSISTGGSANISCHSDALPSPSYNWAIPTHGKVDISEDRRTITIREASSHHYGNYTCEVKNKHGSSSARQHLEVKSEGKDISTLVIILLLLGVLILVAILIFLYFRQKRRKRSYNTDRKNNKISTGEGIPLQEIDLSSEPEKSIVPNPIVICNKNEH